METPNASPVVSVIMANYNGAEFIDLAIASVLTQSFSDLELLVSDDASTDDSRAIVRGIAARDARVKLLETSVNQGPAAARNRALDQARGKWIAIVDADDIVHADRFQHMLEIADREGLVGVADDLTYFSGTVLHPGASLLGGFCKTSPLAATPAMFLDGGTDGAPQLGYLKPMINRAAVGNLRYREDMRIGEDFDFYLRFVLGGGQIHLLTQSFYLYRRHENSISHRLSPEDAEAMIAAQQKVLDQHPDLDATLVSKFAARRAALREAGEFEALVRDIKQRNFGQAIQRAGREPKLLKPLAQIAKSRFANKQHGRVSQANGGSVADFLAPRPQAKTSDTSPRVHVRTPTYDRPDALQRCLQSLIDQTWENWICDVYNDGGLATKEVVDRMNDPRIRFHQNTPRRMASKNIDSCFSRQNPHDADYFFVLEDDNSVLPRFMEDNIRLCETQGVHIVFRNQLIEFNSGTDAAATSTSGILDEKFREGRYAPDVFRLSLIADIGVSNGGLFWSRNCGSDLEVHAECSATLQEYLRTFAIDEPIYVAMEPLAVWADNGEATTRDMGSSAGYFRRELSLKKSVGILQRAAWRLASAQDKMAFLTHPAFRYPEAQRARGLVKSHIGLRAGTKIGFAETVRLAARGGIVRLIGRPEPCVEAFIHRHSAGSA